MDNIPAEEAKERLVELIQAANDLGKQFTVTSDAGSVVILPQETYDNILITLELLSTPGLMDNIDFSCGYEDRIEAIPQAN